MKLVRFTINIYLRHLISVLITVFMIFPLYALAQNQQYLFSGITSLIFFALCYCSGWQYGFRDARKIPGFSPDKSLPVKASLLAMILPLIMIAVRVFAPDIWRVDLPFMTGEVEFFIGGCYISGTPDFIYRMWQLPFAGFMPSGNIAVYFLVLPVQPIAVYTGYSVGLRRFSIMEYVSARIVFSKAPDKKSGKKAKREDSFRR